MLLLFDIDGILFHSNGLGKEIFCQALSEIFGVLVSWTLPAYWGQPDRCMTRSLLRAAGLVAAYP